MSIGITCTCSARLEIDDKFAGQCVTCPDCGQSLRVPDSEGRFQRTSGFALAGIVLALVGAFTIVGTLAAVACGALGLWRIKSHPRRLAGRNLAVASIVLGIAFTGLSVFAYFSPELIVLDPLLRRTRWIGKLKYDGPLEVQRPQSGFAISRPSRRWGVMTQNGARSDLWDGGNRDFLMVDPGSRAFVLVLPETLLEFKNLTFDACKERGKRIFREIDLSGPLTRGRHKETDLVLYKKGNRYEFDEEKQTELYEAKVDKIGGGRTQTFLLRIIRKKNDSMMYVVAAGADKSRFKKLQYQLRQALASFRMLNRPLGGVFNLNLP